jgi:hypothetical protein
VNEEKSKKLDDVPFISENSRKFDIDLTVDECCEVIKKVFLAAAEREISVGDGVNVWIIRCNKNEDEKRIINKIEDEKRIINKIEDEKRIINKIEDEKRINLDNDVSNNRVEKSEMISTETDQDSMRNRGTAENDEELLNTSSLTEKINNTKQDSLLPASEKTSTKIIRIRNKKKIGKNGFFTIEKRYFKLPSH